MEATQTDNYLPKDEEDKLTPIQDFYRGGVVFITGGTGFLGKILIEKLLRSCPGVKRIYLLVREKKGLGVEQRVKELLEDRVFEKVNDCLGKVSAMSGDCTLAGLGLSPSDRRVLADEVTHVFHVAATVRFDEKLKLALAINVSGTRDVLDLCRQMDKLKSVIHVSTAYANCHLRVIEERFYDHPLEGEQLIQLLDKLGDREAERATPRLLGRWPNTYSLTKALAEKLVLERGAGLPLGVFRPAIVVSCYREPLAGWTDNYYGPTGVCAAAMMGVLRTMHCHEEVNANLVPVDMCVAALLAAGWDVHLRSQGSASATTSSSDPPVYNYVSSAEKPLDWSAYNRINMMYGEMYPLSGAVFSDREFHMCRSAWGQSALLGAMHLAPALLTDLLAATMGREPGALKVHHKIAKFSKVVSHFSTNDWKFTNGNVTAMRDKMTTRDLEIFDFDMRKLDWLDFFRSYVLGIREHLFKEDISTLPLARQRQNKMHLAFSVLKMVLFYLTIYTLWMAFSGIVRTGVSFLGF